MNKENIMPRIKPNVSYNKIQLRELIKELYDNEKYCLNVLFRYYDSLIEIEKDDDILKTFQKSILYEVDFFKQIAYLSIPLSFYLEFLPNVCDMLDFGENFNKGLLSLYMRILQAHNNSYPI